MVGFKQLTIATLYSRQIFLASIRSIFLELLLIYKKKKKIKVATGGPVASYKDLINNKMTKGEKMFLTNL